MQPRILKYILDIESIIKEIELIKQNCENNFHNFCDNIIYQRAIERNLEIIGEAIRKVLELNPTIQISGTKNIIGLRNIISHAYDSIEPEMLWGIIQKNIPVLGEEIKKLRE
jgi:uncharacterized protein with HEPN domain